MRQFLLVLAAAIAQAQSPEVQRLLDESLSQLNQQHFDDAIQSAQQAIDASRANSDKKGLTRAFLSLSNAYYNSRKLDEALIAAKQGEAIAEEIGDTEYRIRNAQLAGSSLRDQGKLDEALVYYNRALDLSRTTGDKTRESSTLRLMALLYRLTGDYSRATPLIQQSLSIGYELKNGVLELNALWLLGVFEAEQKQWDRALEHFDAALKLQPADGQMRSQILTGLATALCSVGQFDRCTEINRQQLELAIAAGNQLQIAYGYLHLGYPQSLQGNYADAYDNTVKALSALRQAAHTPSEEWAFQAAVGQRLKDLGRDREAVPYYQEAIAIVERLREGLLPTEQARASSVAATKPLFDDTVDILFGLDPSQALETAELSRARAFLSILAESKVDLRQKLSASDRDRETALFDRMSAIQKELWRPNVTPAVSKQKTADLASAENDLERLRLEIRRSNPHLAAVQYPKPLGLTQIQQDVLKPGTALIEYWLGEKRSFVWAISRGQSMSAVLPPGKEIEALAGAFRKSLTAPVSSLTLGNAEAETALLSARLYAMLLKPVEQFLAGGQSIVIVPDGALYYVPFEALSVSGKAGYLLERFPVSYAPSATSLAELGQPAPQSRMLLAFGDPVYTGVAPGVDRGPDLGALPYTRDEVNGIAALFPKGKSAIYLGSDAREETVKAEDLERYRYIHFAAHGILDEAHPSRSGLALTARGGGKEDGILRVDEIAALRIRADVVTLSACSTGLGELVSGEGMLGLVRAFLYAGSSSVNVSLWNVNDAATASLMKEFYRNLSRSASPQEALRRAKISLIHQTGSPWRHPHFWAPFVLWLR